MTAIENETAHKNTEIGGLNKQKEELSGQLAVYGSKQEEAQRVHEEILAEIERITAEIENRQNSIFEILNEKSTINADNQKYKTMLEQLTENLRITLFNLFRQLLYRFIGCIKLSCLCADYRILRTFFTLSADNAAA